MGMMSEPFKGGDVFIDASFGHSELFQLVRSTFVLCIVDECIPEVLFEGFPGSHAERERCFLGLEFVEPFVGTLGPSFDLGSFNQGEKVCTPFYWVAQNCGIVVHEHETFGLCEEPEHALTITIKAVGRGSFKTEVACNV